VEASAGVAHDATRGDIAPTAPLPGTRPARRFQRLSPRRLRQPTSSSRRAQRAREIAEGPSDGATLKRDAIYRRSLAVADVTAATLAFFVAVPLTGWASPTPLALLAIAFVVLTAKVSGLYERDELVVHKTTLDEAPILLWVATISALTVSLFAPELMTGGLSRGQVLAGWVTLFGLAAALRVAARRVARAVASEEILIVLGRADAANALAARLEMSPGVNATIVGRVPLEPEPAGQQDDRVLGDFTTLGIVLAEHDVNRVVIAPETSDSERVLHAIRLVKALGVKVSVLPRLFEVVGSAVEFDVVDGITLLGVRRYGLNRSSRRLKRTLDIVLATLILIALAPLMALVALAIKLDSTGTGVFRQRRMGRANVPFEIFKFRTMVSGADASKAALLAQNEAGGGLFKIKHDPRVTRVGAVLRRASIDELPQLFNVLRGEMALVGPRPLVAEEDQQVEGWQRRRLLLSPGMTGLWQVFGSARIPLHDMVKIDYLYGANWSLWLDIKILLKTVPFVVGRRGL
jgi:exopolysaccharide biosynthesis polyprenyl glycosylphosphotransferase